MTEPTPPRPEEARARLDEVTQSIRPQLHRYCARMTGSIVDGEDIVQETLAKAYDSLPTTAKVTNLEGWLFRVAHNKAIDHLRRTNRQYTEQLDDAPPVAAEETPLEEKELASIALSLFLKLAPAQRGCVFMKDVMGYSLSEVSELFDMSLSAVKAALHRGRSRLRALSENVETASPPQFRGPQADQLANYIDRFNARDFDTLRAMLADDVRLDLISKTKLHGPEEVGGYFHRYSEVEDWHLGPGFIEGRPAILVYDPHKPSSAPSYFVLIEWENDRVAQIRDFRYARYVMADAHFTSS